MNFVLLLRNCTKSCIHQTKRTISLSAQHLVEERIPQLNRNEFTEVRIPVPWGHIAGRWYGDQQQRPLLAVHGWLDNCGTFARLAPLLAPHTSVLCVDLPGQGYSSHLPVDMVYDDLQHVQDLLHIMKTFNWDKVSLMGHSLGASISFHLAAFFPGCVDMIISLDVVKMRYFTPDAPLGPTLKYSKKKERTESEPPTYTFEECEHLLHKGLDSSIDLENCKYILERNIKESEKYPGRFYFARDGRIKYMKLYNPNKDLYTEMALRICKEKVPHLLITGGASTNCSALAREAIDIMSENNEFFELYEVPGGTHHLHLNMPEPVANFIIPFLQKYRAPSKLHNTFPAKISTY